MPTSAIQSTHFSHIPPCSSHLAKSDPSNRQANKNDEQVKKRKTLVSGQQLSRSVVELTQHFREVKTQQLLSRHSRRNGSEDTSQLGGRGRGSVDRRMNVHTQYVRRKNCNSSTLLSSTLTRHHYSSTKRGSEDTTTLIENMCARREDKNSRRRIQDLSSGIERAAVRE